MVLKEGGGLNFQPETISRVSAKGLLVQLDDGHFRKARLQSSALL